MDIIKNLIDIDVLVSVISSLVTLTLNESWRITSGHYKLYQAESLVILLCQMQYHCWRLQRPLVWSVVTNMENIWRYPVSENAEMILWLIWNINSEKTLWKNGCCPSGCDVYISKPRFLHRMMFSVGSGDPRVETSLTTWNYADGKLWLSKGIYSICISILWLP